MGKTAGCCLAGWLTGRLACRGEPESYFSECPNVTTARHGTAHTAENSAWTATRHLPRAMTHPPHGVRASQNKIKPNKTQNHEKREKRKKNEKEKKKICNFTRDAETKNNLHVDRLVKC